MLSQLIELVDPEAWTKEQAPLDRPEDLTMTPELRDRVMTAYRARRARLDEIVATIRQSELPVESQAAIADMLVQTEALLDQQEEMSEEILDRGAPSPTELFFTVIEMPDNYVRSFLSNVRQLLASLQGEAFKDLAKLKSDGRS